MARHGDEHEAEIDGDSTVVFNPAADATAAGASGSAVAGAFGWALIIEKGPRAGLTYVLANGDTVIGRDAEADIFLGDITVSRRHALITADGDTLRCQDLGSTNGTYVNGAWVDAYVLSAGDEVIIGRFHLVVARGSL